MTTPSSAATLLSAHPLDVGLIMITREIKAQPDREAENIVGIAEYFLSAVIHLSPATIVARDSEKSPIPWHAIKDERRIEIYSHKKILFRTILARFGYYYMGEQMYGGEADCALLQEDKVCDVRFTMRNNQQEGFWIKIESKPNNKGCI